MDESKRKRGRVWRIFKKQNDTHLTWLIVALDAGQGVDVADDVEDGNDEEQFFGGHLEEGKDPNGMGIN